MLRWAGEGFFTSAFEQTFISAFCTVNVGFFLEGGFLLVFIIDMVDNELRMYVGCYIVRLLISFL